NPNVKPDINYYLGISFHIEREWNKAIDQYNLFVKKATSPDIADLKKDAVKKVQECKNGIELEKQKARVWIDNLGTTINSKYPDYAPVISADEAVMFFTARRPDNESLSPDGD